MIIAIPFHEGDKPQAIRLAGWITELGANPKHQCLIVHHKHTDASEVLDAIRPAFRNVVDMAIPDRDPCEKTKGMNVLFRRVAYQVGATGKEPFLWLEPDAVPLHPDWADVIADAYAANVNARTQFLGTVSAGARPQMNPVGVYPQRCVDIAPLTVHCESVAFSTNGRSQVIPRLFKTELFQEGTGKATLEDLRPGAVIYHGDKDGDLIPLLRASGVCVRPEPPPEPEKPATKPAATVRPIVSGPERALKEDRDEVPPEEDEEFKHGIPETATDYLAAAKAAQVIKSPTVAQMRKLVRAAASEGRITSFTPTQIANLNTKDCIAALAEAAAYDADSSMGG